MILASGARDDGAPRILIGLTQAEIVHSIASGLPVKVNSEAVDPRFPAMQVLVLLGPTDEAMLAQLRARYPGIWEVPSV